MFRNEVNFPLKMNVDIWRAAVGTIQGDRIYPILASAYITRKISEEIFAPY